MIKWLLRLVILLLILLIGSYFFRVDFGDGKVTISPRSASDRAKFWPDWHVQDSAPQQRPAEGKPKPKAPEAKPAQTKSAEPSQKQTPAAPVKPKDNISNKDKKALESILEQEL